MIDPAVRDFPFPDFTCEVKTAAFANFWTVGDVSLLWTLAGRNKRLSASSVHLCSSPANATRNALWHGPLLKVTLICREVSVSARTCALAIWPYWQFPTCLWRCPWTGFMWILRNQRQFIQTTSWVVFKMQFLDLHQRCSLGFGFCEGI